MTEVSSNIVHAIFRASVNVLTWSAICRPIWGPVASADYDLTSLDRNVTVAGAHPDPLKRSAHLDMALANIKHMRAHLADAETAITTARDAANYEAGAA